MSKQTDEYLTAFLAQFPELTPDERDALARSLVVEMYPKGSILVREGAVCRYCYFVLKGCLRQYLTVDGVEKTTRFYTENQAAVLFSSYAGQGPSAYSLSCLEDAVLMIGEVSQEAAMYRQFPKLTQITRTIMEQDLGKMQDELAFFIASSPEERYLHLLKTKPDLLQRVPQYQLASYLGVTPESLSRIRKRIMQPG